MEELKTELDSSINTKNSLAKYNLEELENANKIICNEYDWTLVFTTSKSIDVDKKNLLFDLQKVSYLILLLEVRPSRLSLIHTSQRPH